MVRGPYGICNRYAITGVQSIRRIALYIIWTQTVVSSFACSTPSGPPPRPSGVPADAKWAGGSDGGAWVRCAADAGGYWCTVYDDETGEVWVRGLFVTSSERRESRPADLTYRSFDGRAIHLADGHVLDPASDYTPG
jgi:hypothetical protein